MNSPHQPAAQNRNRAKTPSATCPARPGFLLAAACLAALVLLLLQLRPGNKPVPPEPGVSVAGESAPSGNQTNTTPKLAASSLALRKGDRLTYRFHQDRTVQVQGASFAGIITKGATNQSVALLVTQGGNLVVNVYDETENGWVVGFSLENAVVETSAEGNRAPSDGSEAALRNEILAFVEKSGRLGKIITQTNATSETLNHWRDILARWQIILPANPAARTWSQTEEDATGVYVAAYSRDTNQPPAVLQKRKQQYLSLSSAGQTNLQTRSQVNGNTVAHLDPYPVKIEGREQLTILAPEIGGGVVSEANYTFDLQSATAAPEVEQAGALVARRLETTGTPFSWAAADGPDRLSTAVDVEGTTMQEQLAELEQLLAAGLSGTSAEVRTLEKIVALIKKDDAAVDALVSRLSRHLEAKDEPLASALIGMLGAAGTPKAQRTLIGLVAASEWPQAQREMAIFSFAQVTEPIPEVDNWLRQLHQKGDDLSNNSLLVLAAMGDRVRESSPERFQTISKYVTEAASAPGMELNERVVGLDAIGNLGPKEVPEVVRNALASDDPLLREKAVLSLKRVEDSAASGLIRSALRDDSAEGVRIAAASLLADERWSDASQDLAYAAAHDSSEQVRVAAITALGEQLDSNPDFSRVLKQIAAQDQSVDVRAAAGQVLSSHKSFEVGQNSQGADEPVAP